jgi:hypothetical protein
MVQLTNLISQLPNLVYSILTNLSLPDQLQFIDPELVKESLKELVTSLLRSTADYFPPEFLEPGVF